MLYKSEYESIIVVSSHEMTKQNRGLLRMTKSCLWALTFVGLCAPSPAAIFTFEGVANLTVTPFSVVSGTTTANFASPQGPAFFVATTGAFSSLTGNVLVD